MPAVTYETKRVPCPHCGKMLDRATSIGEPGEPKSGDITLCIGCGNVLEFTPHGFSAADLSKLQVSEKQKRQLAWLQQQIWGRNN